MASFNTLSCCTSACCDIILNNNKNNSMLECMLITCNVAFSLFHCMHTSTMKIHFWTVFYAFCHQLF